MPECFDDLSLDTLAAADVHGSSSRERLRQPRRSSAALHLTKAHAARNPVPQIARTPLKQVVSMKHFFPTSKRPQHCLNRTPNPVFHPHLHT